MPRFKPRALDVETADEPERPEARPGHYAHEVLSRRPPHMNQQYMEVARDRPWGRTRACAIPFGLSGLTTEDPESHESQQNDAPPEVTEDALVHLTGSASDMIRSDPRVQWTRKMDDVTRFRTQGDVRLIDTDHCGVQFPGCTEPFYLPCSCLDPVGAGVGSGLYLVEDGTTSGSLRPGLLAVLRTDAKAIATISPFPWTLALDSLMNGHVEGTVRQVFRGSRSALCRVQFGGHLWSIPVACLERNDGYEQTPEGVYEAVPGKTCESPYLQAYITACEQLRCKPNSALAAQLTHPYISKLDFRSNYIGDAGLRCVCEVLRINTSITAVDLAENALDDTAVRPLIETLRGDRVVTQLDLSSNPLTYTTGRALKQLLISNPSLTSVTVKGTSIPDSLQDMIHVNEVNTAET